MDRLTRTVTETAKLLGIGRGQAYDAVRRGEIRAIRLGKRLVVPKVAIDQLLEGERRRNHGDDLVVQLPSEPIASPACRSAAARRKSSRRRSGNRGAGAAQ